MSRGIVDLGPIQELIPHWLAVVIALLTQLGDTWFLALALAVLYWLDAPTRDDIAVVAGVWLAGMGLYKGLKEIFDLPRPEQPLLDPTLLPELVRPVYELTAFATGYGFPSGHAVNTTIVYFGLAYVLRASTRRRRYAAAAGVVATVCATRLLLGVHYLVDVVVGVAVGAALLLVARGLMQYSPVDRASVTFGLAVGLGAFFVAASDVHPDALFVTAAALGAFAGWQLIMLGRQLVVLERPLDALSAVVVRGGLAAVAFAPLVGALEYFPLLSAYAASGVVGHVTAGIVVIPVMRHSSHVRRVGVALVFWGKMAVAGVRYALRPETRQRIADRAWIYGVRLRDAFRRWRRR